MGYDRGDSFPFNFLNQMKFHLVQNRNGNCPHDHIPFNVKGKGNIVGSRIKSPRQNPPEKKNNTKIIFFLVFSAQNIVFSAHSTISGLLLKTEFKEKSSFSDELKNKVCQVIVSINLTSFEKHGEKNSAT